MSKKNIKQNESGTCYNNILKTQFSLQCGGECTKWFHTRKEEITKNEFVKSVQHIYRKVVSPIYPTVIVEGPWIYPIYPTIPAIKIS